MLIHWGLIRISLSHPPTSSQSLEIPRLERGGLPAAMIAISRDIPVCGASLPPTVIATNEQAGNCRQLEPRSEMEASG